MKQTSDLIAAALTRARTKAESRNAQIIQSSELTRAEREILLAAGWLQEIMRGWYMLVRPDVSDGDSAAWYANFWDFVRIYLNDRFDNEYCLSAESSLDLHIENPTIPKQVIVIVRKGTGLRTLMHDTSLMIYEDPNNFPSDVTQRQGINIMKLSLAICKVAPSYFKKHPREAELALKSLKSADELTQVIIKNNFKTSAARLIGAYLFLKDDETANAIMNNLKIIGMLITPNNPFEITEPLLQTKRLKSPYAGRIQAMWAQARDVVIANFPSPPGFPTNKKDYLHNVEEIYKDDAYNSLSIEGYQVTHELIERVKNQRWDPEKNELDNNIKNAMAARGYFDAFQEVKNCITKIISGENAREVVENNLQNWYQKLFGPSVKAGIISAESLFGYRNERVFIKNSRHTPPSKEAVPDAMKAFFDCIKKESHPGVKAILGHYFFVYIHPYMDGNGRLGRFLMNAFFASGGYFWTVVRVNQRNHYINTLENTHTNFDLTDFTKFIAAEMLATSF